MIRSRLIQKNGQQSTFINNHTVLCVLNHVMIGIFLYFPFMCSVILGQDLSEFQEILVLKPRKVLSWSGCDTGDRKRLCKRGFSMFDCDSQEELLKNEEMRGNTYRDKGTGLNGNVREGR